MKQLEGLQYPINRQARETFSFSENFSLIEARKESQKLARQLAAKMNHKLNSALHPDKIAKASYVYSIGLLHTVFKYISDLYEENVKKPMFENSVEFLDNKLSSKRLQNNFRHVVDTFPLADIYKGKKTADAYLNELQKSKKDRAVIQDILLIWIINRNPVFSDYNVLFSEQELIRNSEFESIVTYLNHYFEDYKGSSLFNDHILDLLQEPARKYPDSLIKQLKFIQKKYGHLLGDLLNELLISFDLIKEEEKIFFQGHGPVKELDFSGLSDEEHFSSDLFWMPRVVLIAKSTLVWLDQLSKKHGRHIHLLDQIPEEELAELSSWGFNSIWLIGLWERSDASRKIKVSCGNSDAAASAYSLYDYQIAGEIGGWDSFHRLSEKAAKYGIKLASDMVPNHTGIVSDWIFNHADRFAQIDYSPFPGYTYNSQNLSEHSDVGIYLEDHYYQQSDAAVTFKWVNFKTGQTRYIYHGNDGTHMPWNDTAQLDFLNPETREAVIQSILHVARNFRIIRFDAAMTLAKKHIQRLWYPEPGSGGDIPSRSQFSLSSRDFHKRIPREFWQEVVDRINSELPDTLLIAEAFWMMEGFFVRTLGMHRVYNSAFMHMMKNEDNEKYKNTIKNTIAFDPQILKRFVNFMNNPDEETAAEQFGSGDKYIGVCTAMVTMPGLPMFGHGQVEGFYEKYGMEFRRAFRDEQPNTELINRHKNEVFPLMKKRYLFADVDNFLLYDFISGHGVNHNVFAYSNKFEDQKTLVFYNNNYYKTSGTIKHSAEYLDKSPGKMKSLTLAESFGITGSGRTFCLFREVKSDLFFIQRSSGIRDNGFYTDLYGYQVKIFTDFYEAEDDDYNVYETLYNMFCDTGLKDPDRQLKILRLKPLHEKMEGYLHGFRGKDSYGPALKHLKNTLQELKNMVSLKPTGKSRITGGTVSTINRQLAEYLEVEYPTNNILSDFLQQSVSVYSCWSDANILMLFINFASSFSGKAIYDFISDNYIEELLQPICREWFPEKPENISDVILAAVSVIHQIEADGTKKVFENIFSDYRVMRAINVHEYEGTTWFDGELFNEFLFFLCLNFISVSVINKSAGINEKIIVDLLKYASKRRFKSSYKYNYLIS